jgi:signal transduction histidine kinase
MREKTSQSIITALLLGAVVVVAINTFLAYRSVRIMNEGQYSVAQTWESIYSVERVLSSMKDAETGNRGYLVTGLPEYLDPYTSALRDLPGELDAVERAFGKNPEEKQDLIDMRAVIDERLRLLADSIELRKEGETNSAQLVVNSGTGKQEMDHLRRIVSDIQTHQHRLLDERIELSRRSALRARFTVVVAGALDLILILIVLRYLFRERTLRIYARNSADRLNRLQAISDVALTQLTFGELTSELLERVRGVIHADSAVLCMNCEPEVEIAAATGIALTPGKRLMLDPAGPLAQALRTRQMMTLTGQFSSALLAEARDDKTRSLLVLPLTVSGRVTGLLVAGRHQESRFEEVDEQLFSVVADRIALSLDRANAYEAEREARRQAEINAEQVKLLNVELEDRVRQRTAELEATNKELEAFSYSVSHDLRAPLRSIDGFSLAILEDFNESLNDEGRDYIRRIRLGVQRMGGLIDSLLRLSRITRAELNRETVNLSALAEEVGEELKTEQSQREIRFVVEPGLEVMADPRLLRVALENLFGNAVKFTANKPAAHIEFGRSASGEFYVRDNGAGFDMRYAPKLFTAFQRLHGDKDFTGSGIGLATVARVIRRHHGSIRAEAEVGVGATFWFTLG